MPAAATTNKANTSGHSAAWPMADAGTIARIGRADWQI